METIGLILMAIIVIVGFWAIYRAGVASDKLSDRLDRCEVRLDIIEEGKVLEPTEITESQQNNK